MWRVISLLLLFLGLAGFSSADTIPATVSSSSIIQQVYAGNSGCSGQSLTCLDSFIAYYPSQTGGKPEKLLTNGNNWSVVHYFVDGTYQVDWYGTFTPQYTCPSGYDLSGTSCTKSDTPVQGNCPDGYVQSGNTCILPNGVPACSSGQLASFCATHQGDVIDASAYSGGKPNVCDNVHPSISGCQIPKNWGCRATNSFSSSAWKYSGQSCGQSIDGSDGTGMSPTSQKDCGTGEYYGEVNGVPGCYGGGPVPPSTSAPVTQGKDANGNCAAGYVGRIGSSGALECIPSTLPDANANCPSGWNKIGVGGLTVCVDPNSKPGDPIPSGGSSGGSSGNSGNASSPSNSGNASAGSSEDPSKCTLPDWICNLGSGVSGPDGGSPTGTSGGDISGMLDTSDFFGGGSCPAPYVVVVPLYFTQWDWTIDYGPFCMIISKLRPVVIACGFIVAVSLVVRR